MPSSIVSTMLNLKTFMITQMTTWFANIARTSLQMEPRSKALNRDNTDMGFPLIRELYAAF